jgi:hypothetical protein
MKNFIRLNNIPVSQFYLLYYGYRYQIVYLPAGYRPVLLQVMELLLAFMYQGEVTVASHHIIPLMEAAKLLGVQGLTEPLNARSAITIQKERYLYL